MLGHHLCLHYDACWVISMELFNRLAVLPVLSKVYFKSRFSPKSDHKCFITCLLIILYLVIR